MSDEWMGRMAKHSALVAMVDFLAEKDNISNCVAIRIKTTGKQIDADDPAIKELIGPEFKTLNEAFSYDFGKDMATGEDHEDFNPFD